MQLEDYKKHFARKKQKKALKRAWINRDFEIELYWKRATYFWTFIAASFVGYFTLISSSNFVDNLKDTFPQIEYLVICLGFIFSVSWILVNIGSKRWQRNWENHIDMLEDEVTGPIYKLVSKEFSISVTKINLLVSFFVSIIWILLGVKYSISTISFQCNNCSFDWIWTFSNLIVFVFLLLMILGFGRTQKTSRVIEVTLRKTIFAEDGGTKILTNSRTRKSRKKYLIKKPLNKN